MLFYQHDSISPVSQTAGRNTKKTTELDWFNCSYQDSVYGAEVKTKLMITWANKKKAKKRPVVALSEQEWT